MINSPLLPRFAGCVGGKWVGASMGGTIPVINPATGETLATVPDMAEAETCGAIAVAARGQRRPSDPSERREWLSALADRMLEHQKELARIITLEQGKPLRESIVEVEYAAGFFQFFAHELKMLSAPKTLPAKIKGCRWSIYSRPAGVAALITPWNFPLAMLAKKLSAALAAGCGVVVKPSELTPLSSMALWFLAMQAGLPMECMNLVVGRPGRIGQVLCEHPLVRVISFTGSTQTGRRLLAQSAPHIKRLALELGGNAPFVVFQDADLELAADALVANKFRCAGQTCVCANRVFVQEGVHEKFLGLLIPRLKKLRVGNGFDGQTDVGPLINRAGFDKVASHVADALGKGAERLVGFDPPRPAEDWGCYYPPTLLTGVNSGMRVFQDETFGPVLAIAPFTTEEEVLALANDTPYGLAGYIFTSDLRRFQRCVEHLQFGHLVLNSGTGPTPEAPFGGMKQSGFGREGGAEGLAEFLEIQTVVTS